MFTGLIQSIGKIQRNGNRLLINGCGPFAPLNLGDSVAVDGVCLTVVDLVGDSFLADVSEETLSRTTLGDKADKNLFVNLEPALRLSDRLGGHLVSGHVDGIGEINAIQKLKNSWEIEVCWRDPEFCHYMCDKASVSLNGISLTIANCREDNCKFVIAVIPHTWEQTALQYLSIGEEVNLEVDLMAKYAEKLLGLKTKTMDLSINHRKDISMKWLQEQGWT